MVYTASDIATLLDSGAPLVAPEAVIRLLLTDSRNLLQAAETLFFALPGPRRSGEYFVAELYEKGVRNFVVDEQVLAEQFAEANFFVVPDVLAALQQLAAHHRSRFSLPVIGITGSNGKTVVKEWLYQLLQDAFTIVRSPRSYNSQVGVPLSLWQINETHDLAIIEAGISKKGEMQHLAKMIQPTIGVFTNLGEAHSAGFASNGVKLEEKLLLFRQAGVIIANEQYLLKLLVRPHFSWGTGTTCNLRIIRVAKAKDHTTLHLLHLGKNYEITIPFSDDASVQNALTCCAVVLYLGQDLDQLKERFAKLHAVDMRLHFFEGINNCNIINDSYSADLTSLSVALNFMEQQQTGQQRTAILSDFVEGDRDDARLYKNIAAALRQRKVQKVIGIGERIGALLPNYLAEGTTTFFYNNTEEFIRSFRSSSFHNELVLVKGARRFAFEQIAHLFEHKVHQTVLQISINAMVHNLKLHQELLRPGAKLMAMVKALAYGSGGAEIATVLQHNNVDYLGVAYADEGVDLRREGITLPIMVINADASSFDALVDHNLQPVIYSEELLHRFEQYISDQGLHSWPVHLEAETGMNRLGFPVNAFDALGQHIAATGLLKVESIFSHLAASEDPAQDDFTRQQATLFSAAATALQKHLPYPVLKHIANSAAIMRHPDLQFDMVRLGIGLYGVETTNSHLELQPVATLRSTIAQLKHLQPGDTVSYNRRGKIEHPAVIATVRIGYADGYSRRFSNGVGKMWVRSQLAPVIGTVCMDMTMIDVTEVPGVQEGDEVIVFGKDLPVQTVASWAGTIPYEIMTGISQRVKRVYYQE